MKRPGWYIVAYDIADRKRLQKIHRLLKKEGMAVQQSVFFVHGDEPGINRILDKLEAVMDQSKDDIRAYPVTRPGEVWTTGGPIAEFPLVMPGGKVGGPHGWKSSADSKKERKKKSLWSKIFGG